MSRKPTKIIVCERCKRERHFFAKGLCRSCYSYELTKDKKIFCEVCKRDNMKYGNKNVCSSCKTKNSAMKDHEKYKIRHARNEKNRRIRLGDIYNERERERSKTQKRIDQRKKNGIEWQRNNREYLKDYRKRYRTTINPSAIKASEQNRRARHKAAGHLSTEEWNTILEAHNHCCYYCGKSGIHLEQEHKTPLVKGGKHNAENVVPACRACNAKKYTKTEEEFRKSGMR